MAKVSNKAKVGNKDQRRPTKTDNNSQQQCKLYNFFYGAFPSLQFFVNHIMISCPHPNSYSAAS